MAVIENLSQEIKSEWFRLGFLSLSQTDLFKETEFIESDGKCDKLLQEFHRFDEEIGIDGKWAGGSITSVCRGWGSTKVSKMFVCQYFPDQSCVFKPPYAFSFFLLSL